jgi:preprotein translocase subunit SecG
MNQQNKAISEGNSAVLVNNSSIFGARNNLQRNQFLLAKIFLIFFCFIILIFEKKITSFQKHKS